MSKTPLMDELRETNRRTREEHKNCPGTCGAFHRLQILLPQDEIVTWMREEMHRDTESIALLNAAGRYLGSILFGFSSAIQVEGHPSRSIIMLQYIANQTLQRLYTGQDAVEMVVVGGDGQEQLATAEGLLKHGMPKSAKPVGGQS